MTRDSISDELADHDHDHGFGILLQSIARLCETRIKRELKENNIDFNGLQVLAILMSEDGISQKALGDILCFPDYYISRKIDALVNFGFVERIAPRENRRVFLIQLKNDGRKKARDFLKTIEHIDEILFTSLTDEERTEFIGMLYRLNIK